MTSKHAMVALLGFLWAIIGLAYGLTAWLFTGLVMVPVCVTVGLLIGIERNRANHVDRWPPGPGGVS